MLTISPMVTTYSNKIKFKGEDTAPDYETLSQSKVDYYKQQTKELEDLANDTNTPKPAKKLLHGAAVISAALLEGWAVFWGASKLSKVTKIGLMSFKDSKFFGKVKNIFRPEGRIKSTATKVVDFAKDNIEKLRNSEFAQKKVGKVAVGAVNLILKAFEYLGKALKAVGSFIAKPFKKNGAEKVYDDVTKGISVTLGVGSGAAGAYSATMKNKNNAPQKTAEAA